LFGSYYGTLRKIHFYRDSQTGGSNGSINACCLPIGSIAEDKELHNEVFSFSSDDESSSEDDLDLEEESECSDGAVSVASSSTMGSEGFAIMDIWNKSESRDPISVAKGKTRQIM
jgi:hypothetical protein